MTTSALKPDEMVACVRACSALRLPAERGNYFREFVARLVEPAKPALADRLRAMSDDELDAVYAYVRQQQVACR